MMQHTMDDLLAAAPAAVREVLGELAEEAGTGVLVLDAAGAVLWANPAEATARATTRADLMGRDFFRELAPGLEGEGIGPAFRDAVPREAFRLEADTVLAGPWSPRYVRLVIRSTGGTDPGWAVALLEDRTELATERELRRSAARMAALGERAAGLAQEVANPLATIRSFAQLLDDASAGEVQRLALGRIVAECDRIGASLEELAAQVRRAGAEERGGAELNAVVSRVLELQRPALAAAGIQVRPDLQEALSGVAGETGALRQLVLELVVDAARRLAQREGGRLLVVRTRESTDGVALTVYNNGAGPSREQLAHIWEPQPGGLPGLSLAAGIVREQGGAVRAESEEGRSMTITAELPRVGGPPVPRSAASPPPPPPAGPARRLRVLLADDEAGLRAAIRIFLEQRGHHVTEAGDADHAWGLASAEPFDVALVDARMPGDGVRLVERLDALPALAGRAVLMTGDPASVRGEVDASAGRPFLTKPFHMREMLRLLEVLAG